MVSIFRSAFAVLLPGFLFGSLLSACVSKKEHLQLMENRRVEQLQHQKQLDSLKQVLGQSLYTNEQLRLDLAERTGENNILLIMQDKYQQKIDQLTTEIDQLSNQSLSSTQIMNSQLLAKQNEINRLKDVLLAIDNVLVGSDKNLGSLANELRLALQSTQEANYSIENQSGLLRIILSGDYLFRAKSASRINAPAIQLLEQLAQIVQRYPNVNLNLIGHTDNNRPPSPHKSNWAFSALRAANIAQMMSEDFGISTNQLTAAGRGAAEPRASNETARGKAKNRRIELLLQPSREELVRAIRKELRND